MRALVTCWSGCNMPGLDAGEMILFRVFGNKTELFIDREKELETFQVVHSNGYGPPVYGTLENGQAYGFLAGDILDTDTIADSHISSLCARHMAQLHAIKINHENSRHKAEPTLFNGMMKYFNLLPEKFEDPIKNERWDVEGGGGEGEREREHSAVWGRGCLLTNDLHWFNQSINQSINLSINQSIKYIKEGNYLSAMVFFFMFRMY